MADRRPLRPARRPRLVATAVALCAATGVFAADPAVPAQAGSAATPAHAASTAAVPHTAPEAPGATGANPVPIAPPAPAAAAGPTARARVATAPAASDAATGAAANEAPRAVPTAADPALEARMLAITSELRCLVCQNQTIADSHADLAVDLRAEVREMLRAGRTPDEIRRYMTDRYGDFVLYRPPVKPTTLLLWLGPGLLLAVGAVALALALRRRSRLADDRFEPDPLLDEPEGDAPGAPAVRPGAPA
jgi:cytochrome c-type biogenesis protein CcmH